MLDQAAQLEAAKHDLDRSASLSDYEAVDVVWVAIVRIANLEDAQNEHKRFLALLTRLPDAEIADLLQISSVDALLNLSPPLESIRSFIHERLDVEKTTKELVCVRDNRESDPKAALACLAETLKRIRNRRARGFKTPDGPRDQVILEATVEILRNVCDLALKLRT